MSMARSRKIVRGQNVQAEKLSLAKHLRHEMTPAERALWSALRRNGLDGFHFRRQQVIEGFIVDFYCDAAKLAIELDGSVHEQWKYDQSRDKSISLRGVRILRFSNEAMRDSEAGNLTPNPFPRGKGNNRDFFTTPRAAVAPSVALRLALLNRGDPLPPGLSSPDTTSIPPRRGIR